MQKHAERTSFKSKYYVPYKQMLITNYTTSAAAYSLQSNVTRNCNCHQSILTELRKSRTPVETALTHHWPSTGHGIELRANIRTKFNF